MTHKLSRIRSDENGVAGIVVGLVLILIVVVAFFAFYALGYLTPQTGSNCPPSVCGFNTPKSWFRIDATVDVQTPAGGALSLANPKLAMQLSTTPPTGSLPGGFLDSNWRLDVKFAVTYPNGQTYTYDAPQITGTNYQTETSSWWVQGPSTGTYSVRADFWVAQYNCWLCSGGASATASGTFTF